MNKSAELISFERDFDEIVSSDGGTVYVAFKLGTLIEKASSVLCLEEFVYFGDKVTMYLGLLTEKMYERIYH